MKVEVTVQDIANGRPRCGWACPIARAVQRQDSEPEDGVFVTCKEIQIDDGLARFDYRLPRKAREWLKRWDCGEPVEPFSFVAKYVD